MHRKVVWCPEAWGFLPCPVSVQSVNGIREFAALNLMHLYFYFALQNVNLDFYAEHSDLAKFKGHGVLARVGHD